MSDSITLTGMVATTPKSLVTSEGIAIAGFRLAATPAHGDRLSAPDDIETNWYTVTALRTLGTNVVRSIQKGDRVILQGRLRIRDWSAGGQTGTNIEVIAEAIGHDLAWGTTRFLGNSVHGR